MSGTTRKYCILSSLIFPEKCPWKSFCGLVQCDLNEPEVVIFDKWCFVKAESSLPRSRFLDVTQRSPKRCVTSKKRLQGRLTFLLKSVTFFSQPARLQTTTLCYSNGLGPDEKRRTADSFVVNKPSVSPEITAVDRSSTGRWWRCKR